METIKWRSDVELSSVGKRNWNVEMAEKAMIILCDESIVQTKTRKSDLIGQEEIDLLSNK